MGVCAATGAKHRDWVAALLGGADMSDMSRPRPRDAVVGLLVYLAAHVVATAGMVAGTFDWLADRSRAEDKCASPT